MYFFDHHLKLTNISILILTFNKSIILVRRIGIFGKIRTFPFFDGDYFFFDVIYVVRWTWLALSVMKVECSDIRISSKRKYIDQVIVILLLEPKFSLSEIVTICIPNKIVVYDIFIICKTKFSFSCYTY